MYHYLSLEKPRIVMTIHNMEHYGECRQEELSMCSLDGSLYAATFEKENKCGYWEWFDSEMCYQCKTIILRLLRKTGKLDEDLKRYKARTRKLWVALIVACLVVMFKKTEV